MRKTMMNDKRVADGFDHLQAAALEMIQAARAFLDVAEDLLSDREGMAEAMTVLGTVVTAAARAASTSAPEEGLAEGVKGWPLPVDVDEGPQGVQRIRVS
jgi:hypothetical protein